MADERKSRLSDEENSLLDFEEHWRERGRTKSIAIATLGMSTTRYYLALNRVLANPYARLERPELVGRLLRLRERRLDERSGTRGPHQDEGR